MSSQTYYAFLLTVCMFHLHLCCHKRNLCYLEMFAHFAFVSSESHYEFCLNVSMFCICVVWNVPWVLSKCLRVLQLCRGKLTLCSFYNFHLCCLKRIVHSAFIFACFAFVLSQTCLVLLNYVLVLQLCRHNGLVGPVLMKRLYVFRLCRHKRMMGSF